MPLFVSEKELNRLQLIERQHKDVKNVDKKHRQEIEDLTDRNNELQEDVKRAHDKEVRQLRRHIEEHDDVRTEALAEQRREHIRETDKLQGEIDRLAESYDDASDELESKIELLESKIESSAELTARELDLEAREAELLAGSKLVAGRERTLEKKMKEFDARVLDDNESQYKKGFTDGVADTLREGQKLSETANERVFGLAEKALAKETTVIATTTAPVKQGK